MVNRDVRFQTGIVGHGRIGNEMRVISRGNRRLSDNESGATAVEYGLIVALIALGIVGSLTATRGSLQSNYGTISSRMGGATGATQAPAPAPAFAGKTLSSRTSSVRPWGATEYDYGYTDGSLAAYYTAAVYQGTYYRSNATMRDVATGQTYTYAPSEIDTTNGQTRPMSLGVTTYYPSGNVKSYTNYSLDSNGQTMTGSVQNYPDQSGGAGTSGGTVSTPLSQYQGYIDQYNAYKANP